MRNKITPRTVTDKDKKATMFDLKFKSWQMTELHVEENLSLHFEQIFCLYPSEYG
jgi:hypothetical protein